MTKIHASNDLAALSDEDLVRLLRADAWFTPVSGNCWKSSFGARGTACH